MMTEAELIHYACANWDQTPLGFEIGRCLNGTWAKVGEDGRQFIYCYSITFPLAYCIEAQINARMPELAAISGA